MLGIGDSFELDTRVYRHDFDRVWDRVDGFAPLVEGGALPACAELSLYQVVTTAQQECVDLLRLGVLSADLGGSGVGIVQAENARRFVSQGLQSVAHFAFATGKAKHELEAGVRVHFDEIERNHGARLFEVVAGPAEDTFVLAEPSRLDDTRDERVRTLAVAAHLADEISLGDFTLTPGLRFESIRSEALGRLNGNRTDKTSLDILLGGLGAHYAITQDLGVLASAARGFSPVPATVVKPAPGADPPAPDPLAAVPPVPGDPG